LSTSGTVVKEVVRILSSILAFSGASTFSVGSILIGQVSFDGVVYKSSGIAFSGILTSVGEFISNLFARIHPSSDESIGSWTDENELTVDIFNSINESVADDNDYIQSEDNPVSSVYRLKLESAIDPGVNTDHRIRYRYKKDSSSGNVDMVVRLKCGLTIIASWTHNNVSTSWVTSTQLLSDAEADSITDYGDLYLEFQADEV